MVAIAVTRLGGKSVFVGKLGDDDFGHMLAGILEQNGVQASGINFDAGVRTISSRGGQNFTDRRIWNYFSIGMDSQVPYAFHSERKLHPEKFKHQLVHQRT